MRSALIIATLLWSGTARADRAVVVVNGRAAPATRGVVAKTFTSALAGVGWTIGDEMSSRDREAIVACLEKKQPWKCIAPIVKKDEIDRVVVVSVEPDVGDKSFVLTASLVVANGGEPARSREPCPSCNDTLLEQISRGLAMTMVSHAQRFRATLAVTTEPGGALISVDGKPQGTSPTKIVTSPGKHELAIERPGYVRELRRIKLAAGEQADLAVTLTEAPSQMPPPSRPKWPFIVVGAGAVAVTTGTIISLTVDPPPPSEPQPKRLYSVPGISLAVAGGLAIGVGLYLYFRPSASSSPTIAAVPGGGGAVGWTTAF
jgi:hypothetical protein